MSTYVGIHNHPLHHCRDRSHGLLVNNDVDELSLRFDDAAGVPIAEMAGHQSLEAGLIGSKHRLP